MDGIYFALGNIAVCVVVYWAMVNDRPQPADAAHGSPAMPDDDAVLCDRSSLPAKRP